MTSLPSHVSDSYKDDPKDCCLARGLTPLRLCFSVIAAQPTTIPYLSALLPSELELQTLEETDSSEQDDQTDSENAAGNIITVSCQGWNSPSV